jgi:hypothetical protein
VVVAFIRWLFWGTLNLVFRGISLVMVITLGIIIWELWLFFELDIIPYGIITLILFRRFSSMLWLHSQFLSTRMSTLYVLDNPTPNRPKYNFGDWVDLVFLRLVPNMQEYTTFRRRPYPYNLGGYGKYWHYLRKTSAWTVVILLFCLAWSEGYLDPYDMYWVPAWVCFVWIGSVLSLSFPKVVPLRIWWYKRYKFLYLNAAEIFQQISLGLIPRDRPLRRWRIIFAITIPMVLGFLYLWYKQTEALEGIVWS